MARELANWINGYRKYSEDQEAPETYHFWIALSTLASVLRRNVKLDMGIFPIYPNLYVTLVSPAGKIGKSTNIRLAGGILDRIEGIYMGPDSCTREELIQSMVNSETGTQSAVTVHSSEMSSIIDPSGIKMVQFLTDIYDCPNIWRYDTKASGRFTISFPCLNLLAGTTPAWISTGFPEAATQQGFTARTIFVYEDEPRKMSPWLEAPPLELTEALVSDLKHIAGIQGIFSVTPAARQLYEKKYEEWAKGVPTDYRIEGYHNRKRIHVLKVAMLVALAESDLLVIRERDLQLAIDLLEMTEVNMAKAFSAVGKYQHADSLERILKLIIHYGEMPISEVYTRTYHEASKDEIWNILQTLEAMGAIRQVRKEDGLVFVPARPAKESVRLESELARRLREGKEA